MTEKSFVTSQLENAASIFQQRYELYGDNYKRFGPIMAAMFPDGLTLNTADDFGRFGLFVQVMSKTTRYGNMFTSGGHVDSLDDISVYAQMLQEVDHEAAERNAKVPAATEGNAEPPLTTFAASPITDFEEAPTNEVDVDETSKDHPATEPPQVLS